MSSKIDTLLEHLKGINPFSVQLKKPDPFPNQPPPDPFLNQPPPDPFLNQPPPDPFTNQPPLPPPEDD